VWRTSQEAPEDDVFERLDVGAGRMFSEIEGCVDRLGGPSDKVAKRLDEAEKKVKRTWWEKLQFYIEAK